MKETWYEITDYKDVENGKYFVSDMGRVKKVDEKLETILKQHPNLRGGYLCVSLYSSASQKTYYRTVHSFVKNIAQDIIREYSIQTSTTSETNKCNSKENKTQLWTKGLA